MNSFDRFPSSLLIPPISNLKGTVSLPGSKSISNRVLLISALANGKTRLHRLLKSDDTRYMGEGLEALGISIELSENNAEAVVCGNGGPISCDSADLFLGNAGTAMRSLCAALCLGKGYFRLAGEPRMTERPIRDLVDALTELGATIRYEGTEGYPPLLIEAHGLRGGRVSIRGNISSQYLTALLICAPYCESPLHISIEGSLISKPYIALTLKVMKDFGIEVRHENFQEFDIPQGVYRSPGEYSIEGDASSASYFLAGAAIAGGPVRVTGVGTKSAQGDVGFVKVLEKMGAVVRLGDDWIECEKGTLRGVDLDLNDIPDAAMTVAILALFADGPTTIRNIGSWRVKETDRIEALTAELRKVGAAVESSIDSIEITPPKELKSASIETYNDHRMAMCFSLVALGGVPITILDPGCVRKTYPQFFDDFKSLT
ncbi:MAG: 3-phosphoshikimate 1-carboxyvinyltransferase [Fibrobacter sp.]|jgi:3-phosphoshikimate 1-carboxyvinyltransferase|nr:3-phosphoshikimate 1-carboxyvinyltransferase [Fibrobacter sp.]